MRFVSQETNSCIENGPGVHANFGLIFNKWLPYHYNRDKLEPEVAQNPGPLVDVFKSGKNSAAEVLKKHHIRQANYCLAMERGGWIPFIFHAKLTAPFVSGLGMSHPTETGLVLDHTSGMPYIPAASQKGVLRIAHLINSLRDENDKFLDEDFLVEKGVVEITNGQMNWLEDDDSKTLFGSSDNKDSLAGKLTILDAYPLQPPELGEDILTPHYNDYYQEKRGPTEDQSPVPIKFLVVKPGAEFVFRLLLRLPHPMNSQQNQEKLISSVNKNIQRVFRETGLGAKTSLGFGRFQIISSGKDPEKVLTWLQDDEPLWFAHIRKIETVTEWGQFRQAVLVAEIDQKWKVRGDVAGAVMEAAKRAYENCPDNWDESRDQLVKKWLHPSGVAWHPLVKKVKPPILRMDTDLLKEISSLEEWKDYKSSSIKISKLEKQCALALKEKFSDWQLKKKGTSEQQKAFKQLNKRLAKMK